MSAGFHGRRGRLSRLRSMLLIAAVVAAAAGAAAEGVDPPWSLLVLQASRLGSTATVEVALDALPAAAEAPKFIDSPRSQPLRASGAQVQRLSVATALDILGGPQVRFENHLWMDPLTRTPLYLVRTRLGLKDYHQRFRFTRDGVFRLQREPASRSESGKPPESWTKIGEHFYPYPSDRQGCAPIIEASMLIPLVERLGAGPGDTIGPLCVFHKRQLHRVSVQREPPQPVRFDYLELRGGVETRRAGTVAAAAAAIASRPIGSYRGEVEAFFRDGSRLFLNPEDQTPLMVSGELPVIGRVELQLKEIHLK